MITKELVLRAMDCQKTAQVFVVMPDGTKLPVEFGHSVFCNGYYDELVLNVIEQNKWIDVEDCDFPFTQIRVEIPEIMLTENEIDIVAGCIGYALRMHLRGEDLSEPRIIQNIDNSLGCVLEFDYNAEEAQASDPDYVECFDDALDFVEDGSPIRKTERAGRGTKNTRLINGLGYRPEITFSVR